MMMRRLTMMFMLPLAFGVVAAAWPGIAVGQDGSRQIAMAARGPRFFIMRTANAPPVEVDARQNAQLRQVVSLNFEHATIGQLLDAIERQTGLKIFYSKETLPPDRPVRLRADSITLGAALMEILLDTGVDVVLSPKGQVALVKRDNGAMRRYEGALLGRVTDAKTGNGILGAEVLLEKTRWLTRTDSTGRYHLVDIDSGAYMLTVRRIGYLKHSQRVAIVADREATVDMALEPSPVLLDSLVSTATGLQQRRTIANAISTINVDSVTQNAVINNVSDLLQNRVPGLTQQHTSGAPGDPTKMYIRGVHSILHNSDPVVYVNGIRIYSAQSDPRSGNLTNLVPGSSTVPVPGKVERVLPTGLAAPSPIDQIDPNSIEKIEVIKGASATTLYGPDAANGVILITTKQGRAGPTRWNATFTHGRSITPGQYPTAYFSWGHDSLTGVSQFCTISAQSCVRDSLRQFQALNDPNLTLLKSGYSNMVSLTAQGGVQALTYSITGTYGATVSPLTLPAFEAARFQTVFNRGVPDWMGRPLQLHDWSVTSAVRAALGGSGSLVLTAKVSRQEQIRTTLESQLASLAGTYVDTVNGLYYRPGQPTVGTGVQAFSLTPVSEILQNYYIKSTASYLAYTTGLNFDWQPRSWLHTHADAGVDLQPRSDETLLLAGLISPDDSGHIAVGNGRALKGTFNLYGTATKLLGLGFSLRATAGTNLTAETTSDIAATAAGLVPGTSSIAGANRIEGNQIGSNLSNFGWFVAPELVGQRISISAGLRLEGGNANGTRLSGSGTGGLGGLVKLPKIGGAWVISDEPWFPFRGAVLQSLKLMGSYGQAQIQPGPTDRLRLYSGTAGQSSSTLILQTLGNTELRPERSVQFEGGLEGEFLDSRLSVQLALHHTKDIDKILSQTLPGSVAGGLSIKRNIGDVLNTGTELDLGFTPVRQAAVRWSVNLRYSREDNKLVKLGQGVTSDPVHGIVVGYPLFSRWARPILGYGDQNGDGVLQYSEIQLGDSPVFMGRLLPRYLTAFGTNVELFGGMIGIAADFSYISGATQVDQTARTNWVLSRPLFDPTTSFADQAAVLASTRGPDPSDYGLTRDVSTFRFNGLSVRYRAPAAIARFLQAQQLSVAVQGSNLAMHSTYSGRDPDVTAWMPGEGIVDTGQLPQPRTWQLQVNVSY